jgi:hypothetical protein
MSGPTTRRGGAQPTACGRSESAILPVSGDTSVDSAVGERVMRPQFRYRWRGLNDTHRAQSSIRSELRRRGMQRIDQRKALLRSDGGEARIGGHKEQLVLNCRGGEDCGG